MDIDKILSELTLEEKVSLLSGKDFWYTKNIDRLNIEPRMLTDGPHGLRKQKGATDSFDATGAVAATTFPSEATGACSFDKELIYQMGKAIGKECQYEDVACLLGPGLNIKRSPLCGRNFEYYSEDPYLSGMLASSFVNGIQSENVGACLKHFCCNNQENNRQVNDSIVDKRALNEIYLHPFKIAIENSNPMMLMTSYNKVNGTYSSENVEILKNIVRDKWHYDGVCVTDWGGTNDRVSGIKATLNLEMPHATNDGVEEIIEAVKNGELKIEEVDYLVRQVLEFVLKTKNVKHDFSFEENHQVAKKLALSSAVLLKNEENLLPLRQIDKIGVIGEFFTNVRFQGGGSSTTVPNKLDQIQEFFDLNNIEYEYAKGYDLTNDNINEEEINKALEVAKNNKKTILFIGLPEFYESEGFDKDDINLPKSHQKLLEEVLKVNEDVIVILLAGSVINIPYVDKIKSLLLLGLAGEASGSACYDLLFGKVSPSGRLAETFINRLEDNPSYLNFGNKYYTYYKESIYVGYRYYNTVDKNVVFPFGHGLSYTKFKYSDFTLNVDDNELMFSVTLKNVGTMKGREVIQVYVKTPSSKKGREERKLIAFDKVSLDINEEKTVIIKTNINELDYYNLDIDDFCFENGEYEFILGKDSRTNILTIKENLEFEKAVEVPSYYDDYLTINDDNILDISDDKFSKLLKREVPHYDESKKYVYTINSTLEDCRKKLVGRIFLNKLFSEAKKQMGDALGPNMERMILTMPLRGLSMFGDALDKKMILGLVDLLNGHYIKGVKKLTSKKK